MVSQVNDQKRRRGVSFPSDRYPMAWRGTAARLRAPLHPDETRKLPMSSPTTKRSQVVSSPCHARESPDHLLALAYKVPQSGVANVQSSARRVSPTDDGLGECPQDREPRVFVNDASLRGAQAIPGRQAVDPVADLASIERGSARCKDDPHDGQRSASGSYRRLLHASNQFCDLS
ncbi:hypothetical protein DOTSEDRAFT_38583 [Dothistroma septosporum NZE10]|uniref:Uncharacterized protein n=1 Tax=Dothistroma septosporum (strain NZE10 / CBS 128990) TaxID=675120 RepID=M2Y250_DOTSN|nr:hypothetical protein DOTSEDRAFT_38583 [Dothistroma septosporum NZE10]